MPHAFTSVPRDALRLTPGVETLGIESAFEVAAAARCLEMQGRSVVHAEIGEPDGPTPAHVVEAGVRALRDGATRYAAPAGAAMLRDAIAAHVGERGVTATAEQVVVTSGAKAMLLYAALALVRPGDEVLVPDPGFPIYESVVRLVGGVPVPYPVFPEDGARLDDAIAASITARTRLLVLNLPGNPAGTVASPAALDAVAELAIRHDLAVLSDEIYSRLYFDGAHESIASRPGLAERTILVDGFSKAYAMTGWRLGYGVMPARLAERVAALVINSTSCAPAFVQLAGLAALTGPQQCVADLVSRLRARRDAVVRGLNVIPHVQCASPAAAFYAFPDVTRLLERSGLSTAALARILLDVYGLAALAGSSFGARGEGHVRLSFATSPELLAAALERLAACAYDLSSARQRS